MQQSSNQTVAREPDSQSAAEDETTEDTPGPSNSDCTPQLINSTEKPEPEQPAPAPNSPDNGTEREDTPRASISADQDTSEITPALENIFFETGNPETGATASGTLAVGKVSGSLTTVVVESVPGLMTAPDFCMFVLPFSDRIVHFRPLRLTTEQNRYIVLVKFAHAPDASNFAKAYQGKHYLQGLVEETCCIREVKSMAFGGGSQAEASGFPNSGMFPRDDEDALRSTCAVCLERLDSKNGALVTTFCNHTMHAICLSKWDLNRCPVCRYTHELRPEASVCLICDHRGQLWMCAVCGFVGCGIYANKHAHAHFDETQHPFAINLEDRTFWGGEKLTAGSVWDYSSERFVNRLLTSDDGKVVEVAQDAAGSAGGTSRLAPEAACCSSENVGIVEDEENDRGLLAAVYASRMDAIVDEYRGRLERLEAERASEKDQLQGEIRRLKEAVSKGAKEKRNLQKRMGEVEKEGRNLADKNRFLKNLSDTLLRDNREWNEQVEKLKQQLAESEEAKKGSDEQIRDLMMHIETQAKISEPSSSCRSGPSEMQGGDVRVGPSRRQRLAMKTNRR